MPAPVDATGQIFGRLTAIKKSTPKLSPKGRAKTMWECLCACGSGCVVEISKLRGGHTKSCGCLQLEKANSPRTHGMRMSGDRTKGYRAWSGMKNRCSNPNNEKWEIYGGRGIEVCERWMKFENFIADMGEPIGKGLSIDRIDTNGNYCPENCRWATSSEQANNLRTTIFLSAEGMTLTITQWADRLKTSRDSIKLRLKRGQSFESVHAHFSSRM